MKSILLACTVLFTVSVRADDPKAPANVRFAYVCKYGIANGRLLCRDQLGNKLVDQARLFSYHLVQAYDETAVIAMMKREGFDLTAKVAYSRMNTHLYFIRTSDKPASN